MSATPCESLSPQDARPDCRDLVARAQAGDPEALGRLYDEHARMVFRYVYSKTSSTWLAEDLTSETFLKALRALPSFNLPGSNLAGWLITIARNLVADHYRSGWVRLAVVTDEIQPEPDLSPGPEQLALATLTGSALRKAVDRLPEDQRECIVLRFFAGLSISETSQVLGRSEGAIKQLQWRGVRRLRASIEQENSDSPVLRL
jgi:RNA polymerase sigma-70 factor (ECF subfamily)